MKRHDYAFCTFAHAIVEILV